MLVGVQKKGKFLIQKKMREAMKEHSYLTVAFFSFFQIFLPAPFVLSVTTANPIFFLRQGCRTKLFDVGYVERSSQRAAKAGRFWDKVMLVKAQSLKLISAAVSLLSSSFRQLPKMVAGTELTRINMA